MGSYRFRASWQLAAPPDEVYAALADVAGYPAWWPQVRRARPLADGSGELTARSLLPYDLVFVVSREVEDADGRVLQARLTGDLRGWSRWTVEPSGGGTKATFEQEVDVRKSAVRRAGLLARPALRFNHDFMMHEGERGLRRHLGG